MASAMYQIPSRWNCCYIATLVDLKIFVLLGLWLIWRCDEIRVDVCVGYSSDDNH